jgi:AraC-like DNA-binding protein
MSRQIELSAAYGRLILQSEVASPDELLAGCGISASELAVSEFVDAYKLAAIFSNFDLYVADPAWTGRLGAQFNIAAHGALGFAALSAPTLGEALDVMGTLYPSRNTAMRAELFATDSQYGLRMFDLTGVVEFGKWMAEVVLKVIEVLLSTVLGHPVGDNVQIRFSHCAPDDIGSFTAAYDSQIIFNASQNSIAFPIAWRMMPSPLHDEPVYRSNVIKCREQIEAREQQSSIAATVRNLLRNHFDTQMLQSNANLRPPSLEQIADHLHMTPRTIIRRLHREDTAYKKILESLRRDYAAIMLKDARRSAAEVGEVLGYKEPANFGRAFRRWYGISPAQWRRQK